VTKFFSKNYRAKINLIKAKFFVDYVLYIANIRSMNMNLAALHHHHRHFKSDGAL
jgi:ribonucleotide reductase beta subunit family protein with ferritin-like domain